jgi:hypothetical protein
VVRRFSAPGTRGGNHYAPRPTTSRQAPSKKGRSRRSRRHPRNDFPGNLSDIERCNFLIKPPKQRRVAPLKPNDNRVFPRCTHQKPVNFGLFSRLACIPFADQNLLSLRRVIEHLNPNQRVIQDKICLLEYPERAQGQ